MEPDELVTRLAERQHGLFTRRQAVALGLSRQQIGRRLSSHRWERVGSGVYRVVGAPSRWEQHVVRACLEGPAVASHRTAAALWGIRGFAESIVEVSVARGRRYVRDGARVHESLDLDRVEPVERRGIPTTPFDRTVLDLGAVLPFERYDLVVQRVVAARLTTWQRLLDVLVRHARRGRDGVGRLRAVLDERYGVVPAGSDFEVLVERLLVANDLPAPVRQHEVIDARGSIIARIDLAYPHHLLAIELDGRAFHTELDAFEADRRRQNALVLRGWTVLRFTWRQLVERPGTIVSGVARALRTTTPRTAPQNPAMRA